MRNFILIIFSLLFLTVSANSLKGGVSEEYIPKGFFGCWGVISKLDSSNNPALFNYESRDVWTLSGKGNILVLENLESGARSEITINEKSPEGKTLKFHRQKVVNENNQKVIYKEVVTFVLLEDKFQGTDDFIIERYDLKNKLVKKDSAKYTIIGVRISGH